MPAWRIRVVEAVDDPSGKSTLSVKRIRRRKLARKRVRIGAPDPSLTAMSGVAAVSEFVEKLDVVGTFDERIGSIKKRARGASAGELLVGLSQSQLLGGDALVALDRQRQDVAAVDLSCGASDPGHDRGEPGPPVHIRTFRRCRDRERRGDRQRPPVAAC